MATDFEGDEQLRERLREATSGDTAVRQLRRRYDALRQDYEQLLDRLTELEDRLDAPAPSASAATDPFAAINGALAAPLLDLRDGYVAVANRIQSIVGGLERLAAGALKGQRAALPPTPAPQAPPPPAPPAEAEPPAPTAPARAQRISLDVQGSGFGDLLDFQERLSAVAGVARVTITAIEADRATLSVELVSALRD